MSWVVHGVPFRDRMQAMQVDGDGGLAGGMRRNEEIAKGGEDIHEP